MTTQVQEEERATRKTLEGWVTSDAMDKTRVVRIVRRFRHRLYGKVLTRYTKVYAHDEKNETHVGDRVSLMETRPLSKLKRWRVVEILEKSKGADPLAPTKEKEDKPNKEGSKK